MLELDDEDRRVPAAINIAAGASTAVIVCHDGALTSSSTSGCAATCRSLAGFKPAAVAAGCWGGFSVVVEVVVLEDVVVDVVVVGV